MMMDENYGLVDKRSAKARIFEREIKFEEVRIKLNKEILNGQWPFIDYNEATGRYCVDGDGTVEDVTRAYNEILRSQANLLGLRWDRLLDEYVDSVKCDAGFRMPEGWELVSEHCYWV